MTPNPPDSEDSAPRIALPGGPHAERSPWRSGRTRPGTPQPPRARPGRTDLLGFPSEPGGAFGTPRDSRLRRALAAVDLVAAAVALVVALAVIGDMALSFLPALACVPLLMLVNKVLGLYDHDENVLRKTTLDEAPALLAVSAVYAFSIWLAGPLLVDGRLHRGPILALALLSFLALMAGRSLARWLVVARIAPERCVVIGSTEAAVRVATKLESVHGVNAEVVGRVSLSAAHLEVKPEGTLPVLGDMSTLGIVLSEHDIERAIIAYEGPDSEDLLHAIRLVKALGVKVSVLPRLLEVVGSASTYDDIDGLPLLGVRRYGLTRSSDLVKRALDVAGASAMLLLLAPLFLMVAVAIKLDSRGPVFFRQRRIGRSGERFHMLKFRSMVDGADDAKDELRELNEAVGLFKIEHDPRITRVGRTLRALSIDELPQLINVLKGDMSLVGPRPLVPDEDSKIEGWERCRLYFRPGMTGMWQIFGASRIPMHEMVKIDYLYGTNWSVWRDLKILARTVPVVMGRRGL